MKNLLAALLFVGISLSSSSQENEINLSVIITNSGMEELNLTQKEKIQRKLYTILTNYGIAGDSYFVLFPKYEIYNETLVEGLQNLTVLDIEFSLFIKEIQTGRIYGSLTQRLQAEGTSKTKAIDKSIAKIKTSGDELENFLKVTKKEIMDYYTENCNQINNEANELIQQERFKEAIALLYAVPKSTGRSCYNNIQKKLNEAYLGYMNATCEENIVRAKNAIKNNKNQNALEVLEEIDPDSNCFTEAQQLSVKVGGDLKKGSSEKKTEVTVTGRIEHNSTTKKTDKNGKTVSVSRKSKRIRAIANVQYKSRHEAAMDKLQE